MKGLFSNISRKSAIGSKPSCRSEMIEKPERRSIRHGVYIYARTFRPPPLRNLKVRRYGTDSQRHPRFGGKGSTCNRGRRKSPVSDEDRGTRKRLPLPFLCEPKGLQEKEPYVKKALRGKEVRRESRKKLKRFIRC